MLSMTESTVGSEMSPQIFPIDGFRLVRLSRFQQDRAEREPWGLMKF